MLKCPPGPLYSDELWRDRFIKDHANCFETLIAKENFELPVNYEMYFKVEKDQPYNVMFTEETQIIDWDPYKMPYTIGAKSIYKVPIHNLPKLCISNKYKKCFKKY